MGDFNADDNSTRINDRENMVYRDWINTDPSYRRTSRPQGRCLFHLQLVGCTGLTEDQKIDGVQAGVNANIHMNLEQFMRTDFVY